MVFAVSERLGTVRGIAQAEACGSALIRNQPDTTLAINSIRSTPQSPLARGGIAARHDCSLGALGSPGSASRHPHGRRPTAQAPFLKQVTGALPRPAPITAGKVPHVHRHLCILTRRRDRATIAAVCGRRGELRRQAARQGRRGPTWCRGFHRSLGWCLLCGCSLCARAASALSGSSTIRGEVDHVLGGIHRRSSYNSAIRLLAPLPRRIGGGGMERACIRAVPQ